MENLKSLRNRVVVFSFLSVVLLYGNSVVAAENLNFNMNIEIGMPELGRKVVSSTGRVFLEEKEGVVSSGSIIFSSFNYVGDMKAIELEPFSCSFISTNNEQVVLLLSEGSSYSTSTVSSILLSQQCQLAYTVLESLSFGAQLDSVTNKCAVSVLVPGGDLLNRKQIAFLPSPVVYDNRESVEGGGSVLSAFDVSAEMVACSRRILNDKNMVVESVDYEIDRKFFSENKIDLSNGSALFDIPMPMKADYNYKYISIKVWH